MFHSLTGCDYTAAFNRKGKLRPLKLLQSNVKIQEIFGSFGKGEEVTKEQYEECERFVCCLYGRKQLSSVDELRFEKFLFTL